MWRIRQCELPDWNVEPLGAKEFALPFEALGVDPDALQGECCLEIAFCLKEIPPGQKRVMKSPWTEGVGKNAGEPHAEAGTVDGDSG